MLTRRQRRMSKRDRKLAQQVVAGLERLKVAMCDPDFPLDKLREIEPILRRAYAMLVRDRFGNRHHNHDEVYR